MRIEQEQTRQRWLAAFGLTPWVASLRLPGAAPSELLFLLDEVPAAPVMQATVASTHTDGHADAYSSAHTAARTTATMVTEPAPVSQPKAPDAASQTPAAAASLAPRLCVYQTEQTLVVVEQQDRQAPDLSRDEQQLLQALLQVFGREHKRYSFLCPKQAQHAQDTLGAFASGLAAQGCAKVLLCLSDDARAHLLGKQPRYQHFVLGELAALVISSLGEMLSTPLAHKKQSWQAMCEAGFAR